MKTAISSLETKAVVALFVKTNCITSALYISFTHLYLLMT